MKKLVGHLSTLKRKNEIEVWEDGEINAGQDWNKEIKKKLAAAHIAILLVSSDFTASEYIWDTEIPMMYKRVEKDENFRILPVLARSCNYEDNIAKIGMLPKNENNNLIPIVSNSWDSPDEPYYKVVKELIKVIKGLNENISHENIKESITQEPTKEISNYPNYFDDKGFTLKTTKQIKGSMPLILQNNFTKPLPYGKGKWNPNYQVPYIDLKELDKRILPVICEHYPYLTVSDLLEPSIIKLSYPMDNEYFHTGNIEGFQVSNIDRNLPGEDNYLLPLTKKFFYYFDPEFLDQRTTDGKPCFQITKGEKDSINVELRIPVMSGDFILFARNYKLGLPPKISEKENEGELVKCNFDMGFLPLIHVEKHVKQIIIIADGDVFPETKHFNYSLELFTKQGDLVMPSRIQFRQDKHRHLNYITTKYYVVDCFYDFVVICNGEIKGVLLPKWKEKVKGNKSVTIAVDFGTTNTFAAISFDKGPAMPMQILKNEKQLVTLSEDWLTSVTMKSVILKSLAPYTMGKNEEVTSIIRTAVTEIEGVNYATSYPGTDISIPFFFESQYLLKNEIWIDDLKWRKKSDSEDDGNNKRVEAFLGIILFILRNQVILGGGDLSKVELCWTFSSSMGRNHIASFANIWKSLFESTFNSKIPIKKISESLSPYYSYDDSEIKSGTYPVVNIDISGDTTDVVFFLENQPIYSTSFRFAGNAVFGNGLGDASGNRNGMVNSFSTKINTWINNSDIFILRDMYNKYGGNMGSSKLASFFFSIEENKEVEKSGIDVMSFSRYLSDKEETKIIFVVYFGAIFYHLAKLMKTLKLDMPRQIAFSGKASAMINILDQDTKLKATVGLVRAIFEKVYEKSYHSDGLDLLMSPSSKERTCLGAINLMNMGKEIEEPKTAVLLGDNTQTLLIDSRKTSKNQSDNEIIITGESYSYKDASELKVIEGVEKEAIAFVNLLFEINNQYSFSSKFGTLAGQKLMDCKYELLKDLRDNIKTGLAIRKETVDESEPVVESLFFYPLIGSIHQLIEHLTEK
jgi:TIR domain